MITPDPQKQDLRRRAYSARADQADKAIHSRKICDTFFALQEYHQAETVMLYLDCRSEVQTTDAVTEQLHSRKQIIIPYCTVDDRGDNKLGLWRLNSLKELIPGMWNILEPPKERWGEYGKEINPRRIDLIMVPGVAFDSMGGRLGNGRGYYDRLLGSVRHDTVLVGVGFECQMFDRIPMGKYDVYLDSVITEHSRYQGRGR